METPPTPAAVRQALEQVLDPELGVNIVDLAMVRGVHVEPRRVRVDMTLTSVTCLLWELFVEQIELALEPFASEVEVNFVALPAWDPSDLAPHVRDELIALGFLSVDLAQSA